MLALLDALLTQSVPVEYLAYLTALAVFGITTVWRDSLPSDNLRLRYGIVAVVWLLVLGLAGLATRAGDPGFGQASFILLGALLTWVVLRAWPPPAVEPPPAEIVIETPIDAPEWGISENGYRRLTWATMILATGCVAVFLEWLILAHFAAALGMLLLGSVIAVLPLIIPVRETEATIRRLAERKRRKAWRRHEQ
jgi:ABC-type branched-subunit amino acid transport system permease subunit